MSSTKLGLGLGLEMHKTINRRTRRREVALAHARRWMTMGDGV